MTKIVLKVAGLSQSYGSQTTLSNIDFAIKQGDYVGLIGMNGAGKTTLIKAILDFISINTGRIEIYGQSHRETSSRTSLSFLPEKFLPPHYLTGHDFLCYMAKLNGVQLEQRNIDNIFEVLDLDLLMLKRPIHHYSKGMTQKLGLASCFLSERPMLLFDEPMSGLDPKARACLKQYLGKLKKTEMTLFFSTHLLADVESICDRILILHKGRIRFNGSPKKCCEMYDVDNLEAAYLTCIAA